MVQARSSTMAARGDASMQARMRFIVGHAFTFDARAQTPGVATDPKRDVIYPIRKSTFGSLRFGCQEHDAPLTRNLCRSSTSGTASSHVEASIFTAAFLGTTL